MNRTTLRANLRQYLDPAFKATGYRFVVGRQAYQRKFSEGEQRYHLRVIAAGTGLQIEPSAAIRFTVVEDIFNRTSGLPRSAQNDSATLWAPLQVLAESSREDVVQRVSSEEDVEPAARNLHELHERLVKSYFAENATLIHAEAIINEAPMEACLHSSMPRRASYGVILGALTGRTDWEALVELHRSAVARIDRGFHLPSFEAVVRDLQQNPDLCLGTSPAS